MRAGLGGWVSSLLQNSGGAAAEVSRRRAGDLFCLWKYRDLSDQGMCGETFYLCISAKVSEKVRFPLVAEVSIEVFAKDFPLQSKEERACFTDFYWDNCLGQSVKRLDP